MPRFSFPAAVCALAIIALIVAIAAAASPPVRAQDGITVSRQGVENRFPDGLRFYIDADSAGSPISEIRVHVRKLGQSSRTVYRTVDIEPGHAVSGEATFKSQTANEYIPPGTRLSYYFDLRDADGATLLETEPEIIVYLNRGLDWQSVASGLIQVYYYRHSDQSERRANAVLDIAAATYALMQPILGVELAEPMNIVVYSDYADMQEALPLRSAVAASQLRTLGQAHTNERTLLVDGSSDLFVGDNTLTTAAHEFTHLLVADAAGSAYASVPTWLNEGLAVYSEQNPNSEFGYYLNDAIQKDAVPPLAGLRTFAGTPRETLLNYGIGHAVVSYMLDTYGASKMAALFAGIKATRNMEKALTNTYDLTIHKLDNQWRQSVGLPPRSQATPALPPLQVRPTSRPTPTATPAPAAMSTAAAPAPAAGPTESPASANPPAPTYTPKPPPTRASAPAPSPSPPAPTAPAAGCTAPPPQSGRALPAELAAIALLALPAGLTLAAVRRRRR